MISRVLMRMFFMAVMAFRLHTEPHKERRQHCKNICLEERDKKLKKIYSESEKDRRYRDCVSQCRRQFSEHKDQSEQRYDDDVPSGHVREQTNTQRKRFGE